MSPWYVYIHLTFPSIYIISVAILFFILCFVACLFLSARCAVCKDSGVARICCEEGRSWKLGHGALTADFRAGCISSGLMTNSFVINVVLIERAVSC